jgi:hypothetical protein
MSTGMTIDVANKANNTIPVRAVSSIFIKPSCLLSYFLLIANNGIVPK